MASEKFPLGLVFIFMFFQTSDSTISRPIRLLIRGLLRLLALIGLAGAAMAVTSPGLVVSHSGGVLQVTMNSSRTITDLHTAVSGGGSTLTITVVHDGGSLSLPSAPAGVTTNGSNTVTVDLPTFSTFAGINVVGSSSADTITIGTGGVDLSATTGGAANQSFTINTGSGADVINLSNIIKTKGTGAVSITSESLDGAGLITAPTVTLAAATGIGATNPLNLAATTIAANSTNGKVYLNNASTAEVTVASLTTKEITPGLGQLSIIKFAQTGGGGVTFTTVSTIGTTSDGSGEIELTNTGGNMTIGLGGVVSAGTSNVLLVTNTSGNIVLNGSVDSSRGAGAVAIRSAGSISGAGLIYPSGGGRLDDLIAQTGINVKIGDADTGNLTLSTTSGNIVIQSTSSAGFNLPVVTVSGDLSITTSGAITQIGSLVVGGTAAFSAGANAITLESPNNAFTGAVSLTNTGSRAASIRNSRATVLGAITVGSLSVNSAGTLTQSGAMSVAGAVTFNSSNTNITLTNTVAAASASFSDTSGTVAFPGNLALSTALVTTAQAYNISITGTTNTLAGATTFLNTGSVTLNDGSGDTTTFTGGLTLTAPSSLSLKGTVATTNANITLGDADTAITITGSYGSPAVLNAGTGNIFLNGNVLGLGANNPLQVITSGSGSTTLTGLNTAEIQLSSGVVTMAHTATQTGGYRVSGGTLRGGSLAGRVGYIFAQSGTSTLAPGVDGPGMMHTNLLLLSSGCTLQIDLQGALATQYDHIEVCSSGTVQLNNAVLSLVPNYSPVAGTVFTIIDNVDPAVVIGTFAGLPEGALITLGATSYRISYVGGTGNDVTLTALTAPSLNLTTPSVASPTSATLGGNVTATGGASLTAVGVVYSATSANSNPQLSGTGVTNVAGTAATGVFTVNATGLTAGTAYSYAAYATNSVGTTYSSVGTFTTTAPEAPTLTFATLTITAAPTATGITYGQTLASSTLSGGTASAAGAFAFTTPSTAPGVGTAAQDVTFTPTDTITYSRYARTPTSVNVTVAKATPTISVAPTASGITYGQTLASSTLSGGTASTAGTFTFTTTSTAPNAGTAAQGVTFTPSSTANYNPAPTTVNVTVAKATPTVTWATLTAITYGTALSSTQLNATANVAGSFTYTPASGTVLTAGTQSLSVGFTPTDTANYHAVSATTVGLTVGQASQTITFGPLAGKTYGAASFTVAATATSTLTPSYSIVSGPATLSGSTVTITGAGTVTVRATQAGNANYLAATAVDQSFTVAKATQTIAFTAPTAITLGKPVTLAATASSGLPVAFAVTGPAAISGSILTFSAAGTVTVTATQAGDDNTLPATATVTLTATTRTDRLINLSFRLRIGAGGNVLIAGFVIGGTEAKQVLIRGIGPALASLGVQGTLANPQLRLYRGSEVIAQNDDWSAGADSAALASAFLRLGAFALAPGSKDAALLVTLAPGAYTAHILTDGVGGVALAEIYDASVNPNADYQRLINLSTLGDVGTGENILIGGFIATGNAPKKVLVRAVGPSLTAFGVAGALADPRLRIFNGAALVAENDNWSAVSTETTATAQAARDTGAFALANGSKDAALILTLAPGAYTAQVSGADGTSTGVALIEVYEVP